MAYIDPDYPTKKAFQQAILDGARPQTYNPLLMFPVKQDGEDVVEGPHYPKPHKWYARVQVEKGRVVKVLA